MSDLLDKGWEKLQVKTFTAWINSNLAQRGVGIENIETDLDDGIRLADLVEIVFEVNLGKINKNPKMRIHKLENLGKSIKFINSFIRDAGIKVEFESGDVADHNLKLILGMVWVIIHKSISLGMTDEALSAKEGLLLWVQKKTAGYTHIDPPGIHGFTKDWTNGLGFAALIHKHLPDAIDYAALAPENKLDNLALAMRVAKERVGIPQLFDPEDLADVDRPDEKSIMTYVALYWKAFTRANRNEAAAQRIARLVARRDANARMRNDYLTKARELKRGLDAQAGTFENRDFGDSMDACRALLANLDAYRGDGKAQLAAKKSEVDALFNTLSVKLRQEGAPPLVPPPALTPDALDKLWIDVGVAERAYEKALRAYLAALRKVEDLWRKFVRRSDAFGAWEADKATYLAADTTSSSLVDAQAKLKMHEAYEEEYTANAPRLDRLRSLGDKIIAVLAAYTERVGARLEPVATQWDALAAQSAARKAQLEAQLDAQQKLEEKRLQEARLSEQVYLWVEDTKEELEDDVYAETIADVESVRGELAAIKEAGAALQPTVDELQAVHAFVAETAGADAPNLFARLSVDTVLSGWTEAQDMLAKREEAIAGEMGVQEKNEALRVDFAAKAAALVAFVDESNTAFKALAGELEEQSGVVSALQEAQAGKQADFTAIEGVHNAIVAANIFQNPHTELGMADVASQWDQLHKQLAEQADFLERELAAKKLADVTPEQMAEFSDVFNHFDTDDSNDLHPHELKACCRALELDVDDADMEQIIAKYDQTGSGTLMRDEFVRFMVDQSTKQDTPEELVKALSIFADSRPYITEEELRKIPSLDEAAVDFLLKTLPAYPRVEGAYDFTTWVGEVSDAELTLYQETGEEAAAPAAEDEAAAPSGENEAAVPAGEEEAAAPVGEEEAAAPAAEE